MSINTPAPASPDPAGPPYPLASPAAGPGAARARIRRLHQDGSTYAGIATAAGLAPATVRDLASGRRRPTRGTAAAVLAMPAEAIPRARLDAGGTRLRLRALHVMGHGSARIARALGVRETAISELVRGDARTVSPRLRDKIADLYDAWWDKRAPERASRARPAFGTPRPTTGWPAGCPGPAKLPAPPAPASPSQTPGPSPPPTGRPASDALRPDATWIRRPPSR